MKHSDSHCVLKEAYKICVKKTEIHMSKMWGEAFEVYGGSHGDYYGHDKKVPLKSYWCWMASFITGMGPIIYQTEHSAKYLKWANSFAEEYYQKVSDRQLNSMHDLGFLYQPYSVALWKLTGDTRHREAALRAADELIKRYNLKGQFIEAWSEMKGTDIEGRAIVDSCMNISLLLWAWKETGHIFYRSIAESCLDTFRAYFLREDGSVCHGFLFDPVTGKVLCEKNSCGYSNGSHWARGTGWFVYGMAIAYSYTREERFLEAAKKAAFKFVECLTEEDGIPVWDFRLPEELPARATRPETKEPSWDESKAENKKYNRDASAAAIMTCAFQLLYQLTKDEFYQLHEKKMIETLCEKYLDRNEEIPGMLKCCNGTMSYTSYGDYFFLQALAHELYQIDTCWN